MGPFAVLLFMVQDLRAEARAADDFRAEELRVRIFRKTAGKDLAARLETWSPGIETSAAWEHDSAWTRLFLELPDEEFKGPDLEPIFGVALRGRSGEDDVRNLLERAWEYRMQGAVPDILELLTDPDPDTRKCAVSRLGPLGGSDIVPRILPLLDDRDEDVRSEALGLVSNFRAKAAIPRVRRMLADPKPEERARAVSILSRIGDRESIPVFVDLLRDRNARLRKAALTGLTELSAWRQFPSIRPLLSDRDGSVREAAVRAAERMAGAEFPDLIRPLLRDKDARVRIAAMDAWGDRERDRMAELIFMLRDPDEYARNGALSRIRWTAPKEAKDEIVRLFRSGQKDYQVLELLGELGATETRGELLPILRNKEGQPDEHVALALGRLGGPEAVRALVELLEESDSKSQDIASRALRHAKPHEAEGPLLGLLDANEMHLRSAGAALLGDLGVKTAVPKLLGMLNPNHEAARLAIGVALAKLGEKEGVEELRRRLRGGRQDERGSAAYHLFHELEARETLPDFVEALSDADSWVRINAIEAVEAWGGPDAGAKISPHLGNKDTHWQAMHAVVRLSHRDSAPKLVELLGSPEDLLRARAAWALSRLGAKEAAPAIRKLLSDGDAWVRGNAAEALAGLGDSESVGAIRKLLTDVESTVRAAAARALGDLDAKEAVPDLVRAARDTEEWTWLAAVEALAEMGAPETKAAVEWLAWTDSWHFATSPVLQRWLHPEGAEGGIGGDGFAMNFVRRPMAWKKLEGLRFVRVPSDRLGEALERMARAAGLALEWPAEVERDRDRLWASQWHEYRGGTGTRVVEARPRAALLAALEQSLRDLDLQAVFEDDRIRLLRPQDAKRFWRDWHLEMRKAK